MSTKRLAYKDRVVVVRVKGPQIHVFPGHICSWPGSHGTGMEVDNIRKTIVWTDQPCRENQNDADDEHEMVFDPSNPCLLTEAEANLLKNSAASIAWFNDTFTSDT